jgi:hypothetical protein
LSGKGLVFLEGVDSQDGDEEAGDEDGLHLFCVKIVIKSMGCDCF